MKMGLKFFFSLICVSAICHYAASATTQMKNEEEDIMLREILTNLVKVSEKVDFLSVRMEKIEEKLSKENDVNELEDIKNRIKDIQIANEKVINETDKISKIERLMLQIVKTTNDHEKNTKNEVENRMSSQCASICEAKAKIWANESSEEIEEKLEKLSFCSDTIFDPCKSNPCLNGGSCEVSSYQCTKCPFFTTGKHCEELKCNKNNRCWQYQSSLFVVFEENGSWDDAYRKCLSLGMTLAMPKDKDTTQFIIHQIQPLYRTSSHHTPAVGVWIGLKNNGSSTWTWVDGSPLGGYTGGKSNFKTMSGERWGSLYLKDDPFSRSDIYWYPQSAKEVANHMQFPLCEKRLSFKFF